MNIQHKLYMLRHKAIRKHCFYTFLSYMLVLTVSAMVIFVLSLNAILPKLTSDRLENEKKRVENALIILVEQIETLADMLTYISEQKGFDRLSTVAGPLSNKDHVYLTYARLYLSSIRNANSLIEDILVFSNNNDTVVTSNYAFPTRKAYNAFYQFADSNEFERDFFPRNHYWKIRFYPERSFPLPSYSSRTNNASVIPLTFPTIQKNAIPAYTNGGVVLLIRSEKMKEILFSNSVLEHGGYIIKDNEGNTISSSNLESMKNCHSFRLNNATFDLEVYVDNDDLWQYAWSIANAILLFMLIGVGIGAVISFFTATHIIEPVAAILKKLEIHKTAENESNVNRIIEQTIDKMLEGNRQLMDITSTTQAHNQQNKTKWYEFKWE